jgi:integrase
MAEKSKRAVKYREHGAGSLVQVRTGVWRIRVLTGYGPNGSPVQTTKTVRGTKAEALAMLDELKRQKHSGHLAPTVETVGSFLDRWVEVSSARWSASTMRRTSGQVRIVRERIGSLKLRELRAGHLAELYAQLTRDGSSAGTVHRLHAVISRALSDAVAWGELGTNVALAAKQSRPRVTLKDPRPATESEARAIIDAARIEVPVIGDLLALAACTGLRRSELVALRWLDVGETHITVNHSIAYRNRSSWSLVPPKSRKVRQVPLTDVAMETLNRRYEAASSTDPEGFIFSEVADDRTPIDPDRVSKVARSARDAAGVTDELDPVHGLRAYVCTVIGSKVSAVEAQAWLGHKSITTTQRYLGRLRDDEAKAAAAIDSAFALPS